MDITRRIFRTALGAAAALVLPLALALPAGAVGAPKPAPSAKKTRGTLTQLSGRAGCLVDRSKPDAHCAVARALKGPGPFMGSRAIAVSPDGKNVYVASSESNALAIFKRSKKTGTLTQLSGKDGCIAVKGNGCASAVGLDGPNSVAVSADGRNVYATSRDSSSITAFRRSPKTGRLTQLPGAEGCLTQLPQPTPVCGTGRALLGPDVVVVSPDGKNVYAGSFFGNAVAVFARNPATGGLAQPTGTAGCIAESASSGCATGVALGAIEGLAISSDGAAVYAGAALSNALTVLSRDPSTGALTQATNGSGCFVDATLAGCTTGVQLSGANAVAVSPGGGDVYVTSLFSNSVTSFTATSSASVLAQLPGVTACTVWLRAVGCSFGHALSAPEGLAISPDGKSLYAAAFLSGAIAVFDRFPKAGPEEGEQPEPAGRVTQKPNRSGCLAPKSVPGCSPGRALRGVSSIALSPDGRFAYSTAFGSNAVDVFRRTTK